MTVDPKRFGAEVRRRRERAHLSQADLAGRAVTAANTIARLERGERGPSLSMAQALAAALGCRIEDLLGKGKR
jgi:transcriptional regulator with XRE-family HTH domain